MPLWAYFGDQTNSDTNRPHQVRLRGVGARDGVGAWVASVTPIDIARIVGRTIILSLLEHEKAFWRVWLKRRA